MSVFIISEKKVLCRALFTSLNIVSLLLGEGAQITVYLKNCDTKSKIVFLISSSLT